MPVQVVRWLLSILLVLPVMTGCASTEGSGTDPRVRPGIGSSSAPLALSLDGSRLWVVNPDADTVSVVDTISLQLLATHPTGAEPRSVASLPDGAVVANRADGSLSVIRSGMIATLIVGPEPGGVVVDATGRYAYVTLSSQDEVVTVDLRGLKVVARTAVGHAPWAIAVTSTPDTGTTLVVTHRYARRTDDQELISDFEAWLSVIRDGEVDEVVIPAQPFGFPNQLEALAVDGEHLLLTHLLTAPNEPNLTHTMLAGGLTRVTLEQGRDRVASSLDLNDARFSTPTNFPRAVAVAPDGQRAYVALAGSDLVMGIDMGNSAKPRLVGFWSVGTNPLGIVVSPDGRRAYVMNYLSRDVSVLDLGDEVRRPEIARVTVTEETLAPDLRRGKVLFNKASDPRISRLGWISCASCHVDGGTDGVTWVISEGLRRSRPLWALDGTAPFHLSATRDEVQDVEHDIRRLMGGTGLAVGQPPPMLGAAATGRSEDLDALSAFVLQGPRVPNAPAVDRELQAAGRKLFEDLGCVSCHGGERWTRSALLNPPGTLDVGSSQRISLMHDVGTYVEGVSGLGRDGFDAPTLLGLHASPRWLHDGSASALAALLTNEQHVGRPLAPDEKGSLATFLMSIDATSEPFE